MQEIQVVQLWRRVTTAYALIQLNEFVCLFPWKRQILPCFTFAKGAFRVLATVAVGVPR